MNDDCLWESKPSAKFIIYYSFFNYNKSPFLGIGSIGLTGFLIIWIFGLAYLLVDASLRQSAGWSGFIAVGVALFLTFSFLIIYSSLLRKSFSYKIYSDRIIIKGGVLRKASISIPLINITDVRTSQNILEKILGISNIHIHTAGSGRRELIFRALDDADTPMRLILRLSSL